MSLSPDGRASAHLGLPRPFARAGAPSARAHSTMDAVKPTRAGIWTAAGDGEEPGGGDRPRTWETVRPPRGDGRSSDRHGPSTWGGRSVLRRRRSITPAWATGATRVTFDPLAATSGPAKKACGRLPRPRDAFGESVARARSGEQGVVVDAGTNARAATTTGGDRSGADVDRVFKNGDHLTERRGPSTKTRRSPAGARWQRGQPAGSRGGPGRREIERPRSSAGPQESIRPPQPFIASPSSSPQPASSPPPTPGRAPSSPRRTPASPP